MVCVDAVSPFFMKEQSLLSLFSFFKSHKCFLLFIRLSRNMYEFISIVDTPYAVTMLKPGHSYKNINTECIG